MTNTPLGAKKKEVTRTIILKTRNLQEQVLTVNLGGIT